MVNGLLLSLLFLSVGAASGAYHLSRPYTRRGFFATMIVMIACVVGLYVVDLGVRNSVPSIHCDKVECNQ